MNGHLDARELRSVLFSKTLGLNLSVEDADIIVGKFNADGDDQIDYKEFSRMLRHLLAMVQETVAHAENDWVLLEDTGGLVSPPPPQPPLHFPRPQGPG